MNILNENNEATTYTINGISDADKCGLFNHIYFVHQIKNFKYTGINILGDGSLEIDCFMPHVSKTEAEDFMNKPIRFYKKDLPNGTISISIRGAMIADYIIDPTIYPDNRIELITETKCCSMFLVDTSNNKILGIRICILQDEIYETIYDVLHTMLNRGCKTIDAITGFQKYVIPISPSKYIKNASYLGREKGSYRTPNLFVPTY